MLEESPVATGQLIHVRTNLRGYLEWFGSTSCKCSSCPSVAPDDHLRDPGTNWQHNFTRFRGVICSRSLFTLLSGKSCRRSDPFLAVAWWKEFAIGSRQWNTFGQMQRSGMSDRSGEEHRRS